MRMYDIALFTMLLSMVLSMLNQTGIFVSGVTVADSWGAGSFVMGEETLNKSIQDTTKEVQESTPNYFFDSVKLSIQAIVAFTVAFADATILAPKLYITILSNMGLGEAANMIGGIIGGMVYIIYVVGIMQLASGRTMKGME